MGRDGSAQEVSCVVALSTTLYPTLLHRKPPPGTSTSTTPNTHSAAAAAASANNAELGGQPREALASGVILEVRQLWQSSSGGGDASPPAARMARSPTRATGDGTLSFRTAFSSPPPPAARMASTTHTCENLYAFVRVKDADHRLSGWFPLNQVYVKLDSATSAFGDSAFPPSSVTLGTSAAAEDSAIAAARGVSDDMTPLSRVLRRPWLSSVYEEVTPGMARTQRARRQLDYLEERLLRDCRTPTTVRYLVYLNTYVFAPWYYAPFGLLNSEYDPALPYREGRHSETDAPSTSDFNPARQREAGAASAPEVPQPFIRDAFLCPFSLRVFSTYAQLHYETRTYRAGRLRPPGDEIYRDELRGLSLFKINGSQHVTYCRHLFLIGKSFLENKLAGHDVHSYYFYVVCMHHRFFPHYVSDASAMYFAGFFSWEKNVDEFNLACIATLPCFGRRAVPRGPSSPPTRSQHAGTGQVDSSPSSPTQPPPVLRNLGQFMIAVSYELAYRRKQIGTPEKPLSDLGAVAYQHYWRRALVRWMKETLNAMRQAAAVDVDEAGGATAEKQREGGSSGGGLIEVVAVVEALATGSGGGGEARGSKALQLGKAPEGRKRTRSVTTTSGGRSATSKVERKSESHSEAEEEEDEESAERDVVGRQLPVTPGERAVRAAVLSSTPTTTSQKLLAGSKTGSGAAPPTSASPAVFTTRITIKEIAAAVRLEEADVLKTLLGLGVLHRSSEDRSTQLLLPQRYVDWMYDEILRREGSMEHAVFQPALLKSRGRAK